MSTYTAKFVKAAHAKAFADRMIEEPGYGVEDIRHKGRTVTFEPADRDRDDRDFFGYMAEVVGYYGAPPLGRVATLNGVPAPRSY